MTSCNNNNESKNMKSNKIKQTVHMAILITAVTIIITTKAITMKKTAIKTVLRLIIYNENKAVVT